MYLSYSSWKLFRSCPRAYMFRHVEKPVLEAPDNKINSLFGTTVGNLFETFYKERLWRCDDPIAELLARADKALDDAILRERESAAGDARKLGANPEQWHAAAVWWDEPKPRIKLNYTSREAVLVDVQEAIPNGVEIIRHHRLIGKGIGAEVVLDSDFDAHRLLGRADFIILRRPLPEDDHVILDGKGSKWRGQYVDFAQLRWYSLLQRRRTGTTPHRVGFVYWRSPPSEAMDWEEITDKVLDDLQAVVMKDVERIEAGALQVSVAKTKATPERRLELIQHHFPVYPGPGCRLCSYVPVCKSGQIMVSQLRRSPEVAGGVEGTVEL